MGAQHLKVGVRRPMGLDAAADWCRGAAEPLLGIL